MHHRCGIQQQYRAIVTALKSKHTTQPILSNIIYVPEIDTLGMSVGTGTPLRDRMRGLGSGRRAAASAGVATPRIGIVGTYCMYICICIYNECVLHCYVGVVR